MTKRKIISIIGARPQFIKAATVSRKLRSLPEVTEKIIHTGQHYDDNMSKIFFQELEIPEPDYNLAVGSNLHGAQTGEILSGTEKILLDERPDHVIVYGDTNSTLAGALAAVKLHIPVSHVEAGLRSHNRKMPEEINRILTDHAADILFTPTTSATDNLLREGIIEEKIFMVGDVMFDAAIYYEKIAQQKSTILEKLGLQNKEYILATVHRAENTDSSINLMSIFNGLIAVAEEINVIMPLHPRTKLALQKVNIYTDVSQKITFIDPVGYLDMMMLQKKAKLIATDSGGIQKEAFFHQTPCITLRNETEWLELVEHGYNKTTGTEKNDIVQGINSMMNKNFNWQRPLYGNGSAAQIIVKSIKKSL